MRIGCITPTFPVDDVQITVPSENFLGYRLVKPTSPLVMTATPLAKDSFSC